MSRIASLLSRSASSWAAPAVAAGSRSAAAHPRLVLHESVREALHASRPSPVVALESTIISHGMPHPENLDTARKVEDAVRSQSAVPATIALLDGHIHVGLDDAQLQRLAECALEKGSATKTGRRDIPSVLAKGAVGGTTVSGTALIANLAGIDIFATGGIGGVHRGAQSNYDISSDLTELARTPVHVFCSGAKSILDIPLTLEYLETHGVSVYSFNPTAEFPGFYTAKTGQFVTSVKDEREAAACIHSAVQLGLTNGSVFGVPIPQQFETIGNEIQQAVETAVREAEENGINRRGKEVTPWLLSRVGQLTKGKSLESNIGLVVNNARVAAKTAVQLQKLHQETGASQETFAFRAQEGSTERTPTPSVLVMGCSALDVTGKANAPSPGSTSPGQVAFSLGGVGRNIAEVVHKILVSTDPGKQALGRVQMVSPLSSDAAGDIIRSGMAKLGMDTAALFQVAEARSPIAFLQLDDANDLVHGVADMSLVESHLTVERVQRALVDSWGTGQAGRRKVVVADANLSAEALTELLVWRSQRTADDPRVLLFEPTSASKCSRIIDAVAALSQKQSDTSRPCIDFATPNLLELENMARRALELGLATIPLPETDLPTVEPVKQLCLSLSPLIGTFLVTMGREGVISASRHPKDADALIFRQHRGPPLVPVSTTGAGDSFAGGVIAYLATAGRDVARLSLSELDGMVGVGLKAAELTLQTKEAVAADMSDCTEHLAALPIRERERSRSL